MPSIKAILLIINGMQFRFPVNKHQKFDNLKQTRKEMRKIIEESTKGMHSFSEPILIRQTTPIKMKKQKNSLPEPKNVSSTPNPETPSLEPETEIELPSQIIENEELDIDIDSSDLNIDDNLDEIISEIDTCYY